MYPTLRDSSIFNSLTGYDILKIICIPIYKNNVIVLKIFHYITTKQEFLRSWTLKIIIDLLY